MRKKYLFIPLICLVLGTSVFAQNTEDKSAGKDKEAAAAKPEASPTPEYTKEEAQGINLVELSLLLYSNGGGRQGMDRIRKTWVEFGNIEIIDSAGKTRKGKYEYRVLRGESLGKAKIRFDHRFPDADYALVFDGGKMFGIFRNSSFDPDNATKKDFTNRIWRGIPALFRYKESGAKLVFKGDDKVLGVDYGVVTMTDKEGRQTDYYISKKTLRVMMIKYEENGVKYKRKFYNYNYAQNTLFPYRTVLWANDKRVEEKRTQTVTFGQEFENEYFAAN